MVVKWRWVGRMVAGVGDRSDVPGEGCGRRRRRWRRRRRRGERGGVVIHGVLLTGWHCTGIENGIYSIADLNRRIQYTNRRHFSTGGLALPKVRSSTACVLASGMTPLSSIISSSSSAVSDCSVSRDQIASSRLRFIRLL